MIDYIMNRASVDSPFADLRAAQAELIELLKSLAVIDSSAGELPRFRCFSDPWLIPIVTEKDANLSLGDVANTLYAVGEHDVASYFGDLATMSPSDADLEDGEIDALLRLKPEKPARNHDPCYSRAVEAAPDAILCVIVNGILVSFSRGGHWDIDHLAFSCAGADHLVDHVSQTSHSLRLIEKKMQEVRTELSQRSFWRLKSLAFPHLTFGVDVESQLNSFDAGLIQLLFRRLADLDSRVAEWRKSGQFPSLLPPITPESDATMSRFRGSRDFRGADGVRYTYEEHIWIDSLYRIHLRKIGDGMQVEVGYIGRHLPTVKFPT